MDLITGSILLFITAFLLVFAILNLLTIFFGAPFLPTKNQDLSEILKLAEIKKNQVFIELGSGDGRVVIEAVKRYQAKGIGIELNPFWIIYSFILSKVKMVKDIKFKQQNFFNSDFSDADVLFIFILPDVFEKLSKKIERECKKGTLIICHGFEMKQLKRYQVKKINRKIFPTYYYRLS